MAGTLAAVMPATPCRTSPTTTALVLADTHVRAGHALRLVERLGDHLTAADVILHAGDVTDAAVLTELGAFAPVYAVLGNNDHGITLPRQRTIELAGCEIAMVHDSGASTGREARLRRWFPEANVVVFGHSHLPWHTVDARASDGHVQHHLNPGSPTQRRRAPRCTVGWLELRGGRVEAVRHDPVD